MILHWETSAGSLVCGAGQRDLNGTLHTTQTHEDVTCKRCRRSIKYRFEVAFLDIARQIGIGGPQTSPLSTLAEVKAEVAGNGVDPGRAQRFVDAFNAPISNHNAGAKDVR